ncbi:hypothetical protein AAHE18_16G165500 [Arachis hypogaea]
MRAIVKFPYGVVKVLKEFATYNALGLLSDDREFINAIKKIAKLSSGFQFRKLFITLFASNSMNKPELVWEDTWRLLELMITRELEILYLTEIKKLLQMNGKILKDFFQMLFPNQELVSHFSNSMIMNELDYDELERKIVLNVASSGIASLLLPGRRTTHSLFCILIKLNEESVTHLSCSLIIWDEAPMTNKLALEAFDRTFCDLMSSNVPSAHDIPFDGKVIVFGGDFRQVLPVIPKGTCAEIVMTSINSLVKVLDIVSAIYSDIDDNHGNALYFQERAILAPTVDIVQQINDFVVDTLSGLEKVYLSYDSIYRSNCQDGIETDWLTTEFFNQITCSRIPKHVLKLKKGAPIILLKNIDQANELCNGIRLIVQDLGDNIIGTEIVSGSNIGDKVFIPRKNSVPSDPGTPFKFQRRQFSISLCFTITINKSQRQTLSLVGIYLRRAIFSHGQLYVAIFKVTTRSGLKILLYNEDDNYWNSTSNIYKKVF